LCINNLPPKEKKLSRVFFALIKNQTPPSPPPKQRGKKITSGFFALTKNNLPPKERNKN
jgi:hypothetical protein